MAQENTPQFGAATLFRLKLGLFNTRLVQGASEPKVTAYLMNRELSDNVGTEEGSLKLHNEEMMQIGARPTMGTFWEETFDTDKTINNSDATTVENIAGTVTRTSDYAIMVEDLIGFLNSSDITGGDKGPLGWLDFEEFSSDFDQFMDSETQLNYRTLIPIECRGRLISDLHRQKKGFRTSRIFSTKNNLNLKKSNENK